jgi:hypothetical protein
VMEQARGQKQEELSGGDRDGQGKGEVRARNEDRDRRRDEDKDRGEDMVVPSNLFEYVIK